MEKYLELFINFYNNNSEKFKFDIPKKLTLSDFEEVKSKHFKCYEIDGSGHYLSIDRLSKDTICFSLEFDDISFISIAINGNVIVEDMIDEKHY